MPSITASLSLLLSLAAWTLADDSYASSCNSVRLVYNQPGQGNGSPNNVNLVANCQQKPGGIYNVDTFINIDYCFTNLNGQLQGKYNGHFGGSCKDFSLQGTVFRAKCLNGNHQYVDTSIDTWYYIGNKGGRMSCFGQYPPS